MCTVNIGIGHDNDLVITEFTDIKVIMDTCTKCSDHSLDLCIAVNSVKTGFLRTLRILPRSGSIACVARFLAVFAEPPAESPSTM